MGSLWATPLGMAGVILVIIGVILAIIGVILLFVDSNQPKSWYTWTLLIVGIVLGIAGALMIAAALNERGCYRVPTPCELGACPKPIVPICTTGCNLVAPATTIVYT